MSDLILNWSIDTLINVGIGFGFFLGFISCGLLYLVDVVLDYFKSRRKK